MDYFVHPGHSHTIRHLTKVNPFEYAEHKPDRPIEEWLLIAACIVLIIFVYKLIWTILKG